MDTDDPKNVIPFGKHKGKTVEEILIVEPGYLDWLIGQEWFRNGHVTLYQTVINRGSETEDTPDHNALQVLFLDDAFCLRFAAALGFDPTRRFEDLRNNEITGLREKHGSIAKKLADPGMSTSSRQQLEFVAQTYVKELEQAQSRRFEPCIENRSFEVRGWDVVFEAPYAGRFQVEIKPSVGDDYPAVLRQINALRQRGYGTTVLFLERYIGVGATVDQFREIFHQADISVVFLADVKGD